MSPVRHGRFAFALAALLVLAFLVAGCGGGDDSNEGSSGGDSMATTGSPAAGSESSGSVSAPALEKAKGFGSEASGSEAREVEGALLGYLEAQANGEWSKACSYLAKDLRELQARIADAEQGGAGECPALATTTERLSPQERADLAAVDIHSVRLEGDSGYIVYADGSGTEVAKPVEDEDGEWKLSSLLASLIEQARSQESP